MVKDRQTSSFIRKTKDLFNFSSSVYFRHKCISILTSLLSLARIIFSKISFISAEQFKKQLIRKWKNADLKEGAHKRRINLLRKKNVALNVTVYVLKCKQATFVAGAELFPTNLKGFLNSFTNICSKLHTTDLSKSDYVTYITLYNLFQVLKQRAFTVTL